MGREVDGQFVEVAAIARESREADDRQPGRERIAVVASRQLEAVGTPINGLAEDRRSRRVAFFSGFGRRVWTRLSRHRAISAGGPPAVNPQTYPA
jgi:hypothetical protein